MVGKIHPMHMIQASRFIPSLEILKDEGVILPLGQLNQPSFDAIDNGMDVSSAEQDDSVATISKGGTTKKNEREHNKTGVSFDISLEDVLRFSALNCSEAAKGLKVSVSTLKRLCKKYGINRWPPRNINKEEPSLMEFDVAKDGAHELREDDSLPSIPHLENKSQPSLGVSISTFKHISGQHGITWGPNGQISVLEPLQNGGGAMTRPDSLDQPSMDALNDGRSLISAERNNLEVTCSEEGTIKTQKREQEKTTGVRIEIYREDLLRCSDMKLGDAARRLKDNTSEVITYFSQSLPSSSGEAIGIQNENSRFQSIKISQNGEVMHVDSSAQEPVVAPKRK